MSISPFFETKIGFDRIRAQVRELATTPGGAALIDAEEFSTSAKAIERRLGLADELRAILVMGGALGQAQDGGFPAGEFTDIAPVVAKARIEGLFLETEEIRALHSAFTAVAEVIAAVPDHAPLLREMSRGVESFPAIVDNIERIIDRFGTVRDGASTELADIRRRIRQHEGDVAKRLQKILAQAQSAGIVDADASLSVRDGRTVIPVAAGNKRKLPGFIHDESASGKTFYVEPVEIVEINNELKELAYAERREIVRILTEFTFSLQPDLEGLAQAGEYLVAMDALRAKARWAVANGAARPIVSDDGRLVLRQARHPLLAQVLGRENVVPLDLALDKERRIIVISGPNAGGKSVCLKTVALLQYAFQCGFLVTALENSEMCVFERLMIDIGDEQSIDNDLSTYSSHLLNMKTMLASAGARAMIFIDEFGSGTEPVMGGAIAESVLERLVERAVYGVITTHYSNIKYFASNHSGVVNGAMAFDVQAIRPLFRLIVGEPGSSFAVEIARKIGLPEEIIRSASEKVGGEQMSLERQLREIARDRRYWEMKRDRIRVADRRVEELETDYAARLAAIKAERAEILRAAKSEARELVAEANRQIESTIKVIRESQAERELTRLARKEVEQFREKIDAPEDTAPFDKLGELGLVSLSNHPTAHIDAEMERVLRRQQRRSEKLKVKSDKLPAAPQNEAGEVVEKAEIKTGTKVRLVDSNTVGEVREVKAKKATVAFGQILSTVAVDRLEAISTGEYKAATRPKTARTVVGSEISERKLQFRPNIDVRGMRPGEAIEAVEGFIDNALMVGVGEVSILHGKGTGALKTEIRRYLKTIPAVASALDDHADRGGAGITVIAFKE